MYIYIYYIYYNYIYKIYIIIYVIIYILYIIYIAHILYIKVFTTNKNNLKIPVDRILLDVYYVYNVQLRYFISSGALKYLHSRGFISLSFSSVQTRELNSHNCRRSKA